MIRLLVDEALPGVRNMAVDEALMRSAGSDAGGVTLRFYRWEPGCLSFGRNQEALGAYDPKAAADLGIDVVRRPTGGRAVYHHQELTYSVTAPAGIWGSLRETYGRINRARAAGLRELGVPARRVEDESENAGRRRTAPRAPRPTPRACFRDPLPGEVTVEGRKLVGSAQWREGGAFLQHGSVLLVDEQHVVDALRTSGGGSKARVDSGAISLAEVLGEPPPADALGAALVLGFERELGTHVRRGTLSPHEAAAAEALARRFADPAWTWRR